MHSVTVTIPGTPVAKGRRLVVCPKCGSQMRPWRKRQVRMCKDTTRPDTLPCFFVQRR